MATTKLRIYEKKANKDGYCWIFVQYVHNEKTTLFSTGEKIKPIDWDAKDSKAKASSGKASNTVYLSIGVSP
jgi:hypothetical protein